QLLLTQTVLGAQALLLLESHGVVGLGATTGAAVLARGAGALLEVLDGLRGQREPEGSGEARLAARTGDVGHEVYLLFACGESSLAAADSATHLTAGLPLGPRSTALVTRGGPMGSLTLGRGCGVCRAAPRPVGRCAPRARAGWGGSSPRPPDHRARTAGRPLRAVRRAHSGTRCRGRASRPRRNGRRAGGPGPPVPSLRARPRSRRRAPCRRRWTWGRWRCARRP